jgi:hypothetical protein
MNRVAVFAFVGLAAVGAAGAGLLVTQTGYTYVHPTGEALIVKDGGVYPQHILEGKQELQQSLEEGRLPKLVVPETEYDFGILNPLTTAEHSFVFRNEGDGPLQLTMGSTTCKCTLSKLSSNGIIRPGEEGRVTLTWNTGHDRQKYEHGAQIITNDPARRHVDLKVRGTVRTRLAATPEALVFSSLEPGQGGTLSTVVFSQIYSNFTVDKSSCTVDGMTWELAPVDGAELDELQATAAQSLTVTTPSDLPPGKFSGVLRLEISSTRDARAEPERHLLELSIAGDVVRPLAVYGEGIDAEGIVDFGVISEGDGKTIGLLMKVRDTQHEISVKGVDVQPNFVKVSFTPHGSGNNAGLYRLVLEVPADAPQCVCMRRTMGQLRIAFDHPRIKELSLRLNLAVAPAGL